jgi:hypothetical protein
MEARYVALLVVPVLLVGCADLVTPVAHSTRTAPAYVRITVAPRDVHGSVSLHDAIRYIDINGAGVDIRKELEPDGDMRVRLPAPGEYAFATWTRTCGNTCATLHRPESRCSASFTAVEGQVTTLEIRFPIGADCAISVSD